MTCTTPRNAASAARPMRPMASAGLASALRFLRTVAASFGHALTAATKPVPDGMQQLHEIEAISANLKLMKPQDPRRGQMTAKARSLRHEILRRKRHA